jgi:signal transduction histidine kinase
MMDETMTSGQLASAEPPIRSVRRDSRQRIIAGVCAGLARYFGVDVLVVRLAFVVAAAAGGFGVGLYLLAWALIPASSEDLPAARRLRAGRGAVEIALGAGLLLLSLLLVLREAGLWFSDAVVWPLVLVATGGALLWGRSIRAPEREPKARPAGAEEPQSRAAVVSRAGLGAVLVVAAALAFLQAAGALSAARDVVLTTLVATLALALIFAPWVARLARSLATERRERVRSEERAEVAAHLHDSVLQTLALMQRRADDPREVATLARRQERELRAWLSGRVASAEEEQRLTAALEAAADEIERNHGVAVEVVVVGDRGLDGPGEALLGAAREAMVNAAKFGEGSRVDVYAELDDERAELFVRDRGPGFDLDSVPEDRRGVRDSIVGRMERAGGRAALRSSPSGGTEVELVIEGSGS